MKLARCASLTQLQNKLLQRLDHKQRLVVWQRLFFRELEILSNFASYKERFNLCLKKADCNS